MNTYGWNIGDEFTYRYKAGGDIFARHDGHHAKIIAFRSTGSGVDFVCLACGKQPILAFWRELEAHIEVPM